MRIAVVLLLALSTAARADEGPAAAAAARADRGVAAAAQPYHHAVSLQLAALSPTGIAVQAERDLGIHKLSLAGSVGLRTAAQGEYASATAGVGIELRRWLRRPSAMTGLYAGIRTDLARTAIEDSAQMRELGALWTWSLGASLGYRWVIARTVEITPSLGMAAVVEGGLRGRSPATARGAGILGLTAGWMF